MIGNDIIDLSLAKTQSNWQRPGFLEKQFTTDEIKMIRNSENPFLLVWRFWSMKEAAYKIVVQQQNRRFFAPKKFACQIISEREGFVRYEDQVFKSNSKKTRKYMYTSIGNPLFSWIGKRTAQEDLLKVIERQVELPSTELKIEKNAFGVPQLYQLGRQISKSFTKTHHGEFEAIEFILN